MGAGARGRGGDNWEGIRGRRNRGHLAQAANAALPPGACPKGTSHKKKHKSSADTKCLSGESSNV